MTPQRTTIMVVFGTRPEAIKMAPLVRALRARSNFEVQVVVTAQHRQMLDQVLDLFGITPNLDLDLMRSGQSLPDLTSRILIAMTAALQRSRPDLLLVHGDTTTTLAASLAGFYAGVQVGHVEAGLRTGDLWAPWPEEMNRKLTAPLCSMHFAPTEQARENLLREGIADQDVFVTGNTIVDALLSIDARLSNEPELAEAMRSHFALLDPHKRLVLVTGHRRENFGDGLARICDSLVAIAARGDVQVIYPVHLNPNVQQAVRDRLSGIANLFLMEPQSYLPFVYLMRRAHLILTDSGGVQEEAPSLGKPVLVMRNTTERPEAVRAGTVRLVGTNVEQIVGTTFALLDDDAAYASMSEAHNPYGDGNASERIATIIANRFLQHASQPSS